GWSGAIGLAPWRLTLLLIGIPGILLSLLFFATTREPPRIAEAGEVEVGSWRDFLRYVLDHRAFYIPFYLGTSLSAMMMISLVIWLPTLLERNYSVPTASAGSWIGMMGMPVGLSSIFFWPCLAQRLERRGLRDALVCC